MAEERRQVSGPPMICATDAIKTGPARIGHLFGNVSLPRTVELTKAIAVLIGAVLGLLFASMVPADSMQKWIFGAVFGGFAGWFISSYSPLRDESMLTWLGLQAKTLTKQRHIDGKPVVVAVGSAVVGRETLGRVRVNRAAVRVPAGRYDERGVLVSARNHNVPDGATVFGAHVYTRPAPTLHPVTAHPVTGPQPPAATEVAPAPLPHAVSPSPAVAPGTRTLRPATLEQRRGSAAAEPARRFGRKQPAPAPAADRPRRPDRPGSQP